MLFREAILQLFPIGMIYQRGRRAGLMRYCVVLAIVEPRANDSYALVVYDPSAGRFPYSTYYCTYTKPVIYLTVPYRRRDIQDTRISIRRNQTVFWRVGQEWPEYLTGEFWDTPLTRLQIK